MNRGSHTNPTLKRWALGLSAAAVLSIVGATFAYAVMLRAGLLPGEERRVTQKKTAGKSASEVTPHVSSGASTSLPRREWPPLWFEETKAPGPQATVERVTIALQPSHQDDTGEGWHEYRICGDIADQTIRAGAGITWVKAWDIEHGLSGSNNYRPRPTNTPAFDVEVAAANKANARYFVSIHNDGGAPSGVLGEHMPGDARGGRLTAYLVDRLSSELGLPNRGVREVRLYSLEPERNKARYRLLLEIGDNVADRAFLSSASNRVKIGRVLATALKSFVRRNR